MESWHRISEGVLLLGKWMGIRPPNPPEEPAGKEEMADRTSSTEKEDGRLGSGVKVGRGSGLRG